jgi:uncharacterized protein YbdZ (MbtH family)
MPDPGSHPVPVPHLPRAEIISRAWAEALALACQDTDHAHRPPGELLAAAMRVHRMLSPKGSGWMSSTPFDAAAGRYYVLVNDELQHSLWPSFAGIPAGWRIVFGEESRDNCLTYLEEQWTGRAAAVDAA